MLHDAGQDLAIARPTFLYLIPRISKMLYDQYEEQVALRCPDGVASAALKQAGEPCTHALQGHLGRCTCLFGGDGWG